MGEREEGWGREGKENRRQTGYLQKVLGSLGKRSQSINVNDVCIILIMRKHAWEDRR